MTTLSCSAWTRATASVAADTQGGFGGSPVIRAAGLTLGKPPLHV